MTDALEIELKFLLPGAPDRQLLGSGVAIAQGYLPGGLRLRRKGGACFLTVKGPGVVARQEWETEVPRWVFERLWPATDGHRLEKTRYRVPHGSYVLEVDEYHGPLEGLWTLECELESEAAAGDLALPSWAASAVDVTADPRYRNVSLASVGWPRDPPGTEG